jgi:Protein of unknown function (DUF2949)
MSTTIEVLSIDFLQHKIGIWAASIGVAWVQAQTTHLLPIVLWRENLLSLEQVFDRWETAARSTTNRIEKASKSEN